MRTTYSPGRRRPAAAILALALALPSVVHSYDDTVLQRIRAAAIEVPTSPRIHPLPLAAHWNTGIVAGGFGPDEQTELLKSGRYLLPWFEIPRPDRELPDAYYGPIRDWARLGLPVAFISTQWDVLVAEALSPRGSKSRDAARPARLTPDSAPELWHAAGRRWGGSPLLARLQQLYPEPPLVLFISNNEQPKMSWQDVRTTGLRLHGADPQASDDELRRAVGDAWILRYRELERGFREALVSEHWRSHARFVGYEAFGQPALGRWPGWAAWSLHSDTRLEPWSSAWDGASIAYYTHDWNPSTDFRVWSPQLESMNLVPMLGAARERDPGFWFEISTWDGRSSRNRNAKDAHYRALGQHWDAARYAGMVQFGMWLLRPRLVREFRDTVSLRRDYAAEFGAVLDAVGRIHDEPVLARFWREGRLLANHRAAHPYQSEVPTAWRSLQRWYLLDADANPTRPWTLETPLAVFALALELGTDGAREWLVYAHSPLVDVRETLVTVPHGPRLRIRATRGGCFSRVHERDGRVEEIAC